MQCTNMVQGDITGIYSDRHRVFRAERRIGNRTQEQAILVMIPGWALVTAWYDK